MATIEEIDELSIEVINGVSSESEESTTRRQSPSNSSSPRASAEVAGPVVVAPAAAAPVAVSQDEVDGEDEEEDDDEDFDESFIERLVGLTEMFPKSVQRTTSVLVFGSLAAAKGLFSFGRSASWVIFSTATILFAPVIFELERAQMEEMQKQQQRQILLGPGAAMSGGAHPGMSGGIGMAPPPPR